MKEQRQLSALVVSVLANERGMAKGGEDERKARGKHEMVRRELPGSDLCSPQPGAIRATLPVPCRDTGGVKM